MTHNEIVVARRKADLVAALETYLSAIQTYEARHPLTMLAKEAVAFERRRYQTALHALSTTKE